MFFNTNFFLFPDKKFETYIDWLTGSLKNQLNLKKYCDDKLDLERSFNAEFPNYTHYKINGHKLRLSKDDSKFMECIAEDWD